jgi:hypothetical protein
MSSGIDNSGTGESSGKKFKPKKNKPGQISSHGPPVEQQSVSVPHENRRQETITSQSSNRSCRFVQNRHRLQISPRLTQKLVILSCRHIVTQTSPSYGHYQNKVERSIIK